MARLLVVLKAQEHLSPECLRQLQHSNEQRVCGDSAADARSPDFLCAMCLFQHAIIRSNPGTPVQRTRTAAHRSNTFPKEEKKEKKHAACHAT